MKTKGRYIRGLWPVFLVLTLIASVFSPLLADAAPVPTPTRIASPTPIKRATTPTRKASASPTPTASPVRGHNPRSANGAASRRATKTGRRQTPSPKVGTTTVLASFLAQNPYDSSNGRAMAFDGTNLWYTYEYDSTGQNRDTHIYKASTSGTLLQNFDVGVPIGALAWDSTRHVLWGGAYDGSGNVYQINPATGVATFEFSFLPSGGNCFYNQPPGSIDGLAYDPGSDTLWMSDDEGSDVFHLSLTSTPPGGQIASFALQTSGYDCNSGIAMQVGTGSSESLWLVDPETTPSDIVQVDLNGSGLSGTFAVTSNDYQPEGIAFDSQTFAPNCALWANESSYSTPTIEAFQVPCASPAPPPPSLSNGLPCAPYRDCGGDPVDTSTGNFRYRHTDVAIPGRGGGVAFNRSYNSDDTTSGPLGPGWAFGYNAHVVDQSSTISVVEGNGRVETYTQNGSSYTPPPGVFDTLQKFTPALGDGTVYLVTRHDQSQLGFDTSGLLLYLKDRYGNKTTLGYVNGQLKTITDPAGRGSLTLSYDPSGHLVSVADWLSSQRTVQFGYDPSGRLTTVTDRNNQTTTYGYDGSSSRLTTIADARGHTALTLAYDSQGRVQSQKDALGLTTGQSTTFSYVTNADGTETTTVTYPQTTYDGVHPTVTDYYDTMGRLIKRVSVPSATESDTELYGYDANFNRTVVTDARGNTTSYCYDVDDNGYPIAGSFGNLTRKIEPPPTSGTNPLVTLYSYDAQNNLVETIPPKGVGNGASVGCDYGWNLNAAYATDYAYDPSGITLQGVTRSDTDPDLGFQTALTQYEYGDPNNPGQVTKVIPPRGNTGASSPLGDKTVEGNSDYLNAGVGKAFAFTATASSSISQLWVYTDTGASAGTLVVGLYVDNGAGSPGNLLAQANVTTARPGGWNPVIIPPTSLTSGTTYWLAVLAPASGFGEPLRDRASGGTSQTLGVTGLNSLPTTWTTGTVTSNSSLSAYAAAPDYTFATSYVYYTAAPDPTQAGMLKSVTDPAGDITSYSYDPVGRVTSMVDPNGNAQGGTPSQHTWTYAYDNEDRLLSLSAPAPVPGGSPLVTQYQYDAVGNRTVVIDANGQVTKYGYDERDSLDEVDQSPLAWTDPLTPPATVYVTQYTYDNLGNLSEVTRAAGDPQNQRTTDYTYDGLNRVRSETQAPLPATTDTYDANGNLQSLKDPNGNTTTYGYDAENRLTAITYSDGKTPKVSYPYDANGNRSQMTDGTGSTTYLYDELDRLTSVTSPGSQTVGYRYDLDGNRDKLIYPDQSPVTYQYDNADRLTSLTDWAQRPATSYQYNPDNTLQKITNVDGSIAQYSYDNAMRLTQVLNTVGSIGTQYTYTLDNVGNRVRIQELANGTGNVYAFGDNSYGQLGTGDTNPHSTPYLVTTIGTVSQIFARDNQSFAIKPNGTVWGWGDNTYGQLGVTTTQTCNGNPCATSPIMVSGASSVVSTATGVGGRHTLALATGGSLYAWGNNDDGQLGDGTTTSRLAAEQITGISDVAVIGAGQDHSLAATNDGTLYAWGSNAYGQLGVTTTQTCGSTPCSESPIPVTGASGVIAVAGGANHSVALTTSGNVYAWGANDKGQVGASNSTCNSLPCQTTPAQVTGLSGITVIAAGDNFSLALKSDGTVWAWGDNSLGQLGIGNTNPANGAVQVPGLSGVTSIAAGANHALVVKSDGTVWAWGSNGSNQLGVTTSQTCGTTACSMSPIQVTGLGGMTAAAAGANHSLTLVTPPGGTAAYQYDQLYRLTNVTAPGRSASYAYDPLGNRTALKQRGTTTTYTYDTADRLTSSGYSSDNNGNLTTIAGNPAIYDQANRLTSLTISGTTTNYTYDGEGKRASKTVGGTATNYVYDINGALPNVLTDGTFKYVYGLGLAYAVDGSGNLQVYHTDGLGSVRAITDGSGTVLATYKTDAFGVPLKTTGNSSQPFQYTGQQRDAESGLYDLRARMYDPAIGRFLSRDPTFGAITNPLSLNRFTYALDNPVGNEDPSGLCLKAACVAEGGAAAFYYLGGAAATASAAVPAVSQALRDSYILRWLSASLSDLPPTIASLTQRAKRRLAKQLGGIPRSADPIAQGRSADGGRWWEYPDGRGGRVIVVEHPDGSVHVGTPKEQSSHREGGPPKYYDNLGPDGEGFGHVGGENSGQ